MKEKIALLLVLMMAAAFADRVTDRLKVCNRAYKREIRIDYESCPGNVVYWYSDGTAKTNTPKRVDCLVMTNNVELVVAKTKKVEKAADKARRKDAKNFEKWVKETEKAKEKSSSEMAEFYDAVLDIANAKEASL